MKEKRHWIHIHMLIGRVLESMSHVNINNNKKEIYYICLYIYKYMFIHKLYQMRSVLAYKTCAKEQTDKKMRTIHGTDISQGIVTRKYILTY